MPRHITVRGVDEYSYHRLSARALVDDPDFVVEKLYNFQSRVELHQRLSRRHVHSVDWPIPPRCGVLDLSIHLYLDRCLTGYRFIGYLRSPSMLLNDNHEIDQLEKTEREEQRYLQYHDMYRTFLNVGLILLALDLLLNYTLLRKLP